MTREYEYIYLIEAFDLANWDKFTPHPGAFKTKKEAVEYIRRNETKFLKFTWRQIEIGVWNE